MILNNKYWEWCIISCLLDERLRHLVCWSFVADSCCKSTKLWITKLITNNVRTNVQQHYFSAVNVQHWISSMYIETVFYAQFCCCFLFFFFFFFFIIVIALMCRVMALRRVYECVTKDVLAKSSITWIESIYYSEITPEQVSRWSLINFQLACIFLLSRSSSLVRYSVQFQ